MAAPEKFYPEFLDYQKPDKVPLAECAVAAQFYLDPEKFRETCLQEAMRLKEFLAQENRGITYTIANYPLEPRGTPGRLQGLRVYQYPQQVSLGGVVILPGDTLCLHEDGRAGVTRGKKVRWATGAFQVMFDREY